ncbi:MAG: hypothetical protein A2W01_06540 [Candidatus Solincola sediminis]|nr:MAG: hypothetical protein A2W01_06540 [Candidatus Solincola sediminis]
MIELLILGREKRLSPQIKPQRKAGKGLFVLLCLLALILSGQGNLLLAQETPSPQLPILLLNGAIYPQRFDPASLPASFRVDGYPANVAALYILQCKDLIKETWVNDIGGIGGQVRGYLPYNALLVALDASAHSRLSELGFVEWSTLYQPFFKIAPALQLGLIQGGKAEVLVEIYSERLLQETLQSLARPGIEILGSELGESSAIISLRLPVDMLKDVAALGAVEWIELSSKGTLCGGISETEVAAVPVNTLADVQSGKEKIALTDSGIGTGGMAGVPSILRNNILDLYSTRGDTGADLNGHGTAVAGVLSDIQGLYEGSSIRPQNSILAYATEYGLNSPARPLSLYSILQNCYEGGARIHLSGSVPEGRGSLGAYGIYSVQRDAFVWNNQEMALVEPAGNEGTDADGDGIIDKGNLLGGAAAKNAISVGGSESARRKSDGADAYNYKTLQDFFPGRFPMAPISEDSSLGEQSGMAAFSSRGPTGDGRIKPDLVAPATYILSAASGGNESLGAISGWEKGYVRAYGTSMAAAQAARDIASLRRLLVLQQGDRPSAALIKAFLVNGAADLAPGQYGAQAQEIPPAPNAVEGWGRLDLETSSNEGSWIEVLDESEGLRPGESRVFRIEATAATILRVTLAWSDYPALPEARLQLVNDLDLRVTDVDGNPVYPNGRNSRDPLNNVERVSMDISGKPGVYTIEVSGWNVPFSPQPFALVAQAF